MGSMSNVALVLSKNGYVDFIKIFYSLYSSRTRFQIEEFIKNSTLFKSDILEGSKAYYWKYVKWKKFSDTTSENFEDPLFNSYAINKILRKLNENDYLLIDIGELNDDNYCVGNFHPNPFGIELKRTISGIEEGTEYDNLQIDRILNKRNVNLIYDYTIKNIILESIYHDLKDGKNIKHNLVKLIFFYLTFIVKDGLYDEDYNDKCINKCIEIINMKENFYKTTKEHYSVSSLNGLVIQRGIQNLITDTTNVFTVLSLIDGIITTLIYKTNNDSMKFTYSKISVTLRWMSPNKDD